LKTNKKVLSLDPDKDTQKKKRKKRDNDEYLVPEETTEEFTPFDYSQVNLKMFDGWLYKNVVIILLIGAFVIVW
jgi:hypothetical protein